MIQRIMAWATSLLVVLAAIYMSATSQAFNLDLLKFARGRTCRCFPGDPCWPSSETWNAFNQTLGGKLIATLPIGSPCHDSFDGVKTFDASECSRIQEQWVNPQLHVDSTHSTMAAFFANESCDPFSDRNTPCVAGTYIVYAVAARDEADYRATIAFARLHNIRLVIRNTGHDYMGKSTGAGALALWTHNIKDIDILDYESPAYSGKAMKIGAGVQAAQAQEVANKAGYVVVEGDCPTVGIAGGYTQGGGTSPLASRYGMAADQVLEWEVVTADGRLLTATPTNNEDLYWALSGGGGGTYAAVLSMTVQLHPDQQTGGAVLSFSDMSNSYWDVVQAFLINLPAILDVGGTVYWMALPGNTFAVPQIYLPGGTAKQIEQLLKPTIDALLQSNIEYHFSSTDYQNFQEAFQSLNPQMDVVEVNLGGRLIPRRQVTSSGLAAQLTETIKNIVNSGALFAGVSINVAKEARFSNSVLPEWRETLFLAFFGIPYNRTNYAANIAAQGIVTSQFGPALEAITPGGGAYLNEADINQADWQNVFYGPNYLKLFSIKRKYDPEDIFWGRTAVGSERWQAVGDGRMCRV